jgi:predicted deacylase
MRRWLRPAVILTLSVAAAPVPLAQGAPAAESARPVAAGPAALVVGTARGEPGKKIHGVLKFAEAADGASFAAPVVIVTGRRPGPVVWADACHHGDEYGGARALQEVVRALDPETMSGTLVALPISNPPAFQGLQRVNPNLDDLIDMGSAFPGNPAGFASERIAAALFARIRETAAYFVDLHTGGDRFRQAPFVLYSVAAKVPAATSDDLARGFGVPLLWRDTVKVFPTDAVLQLAGEGVPAFLLEVGGGQPLDPADLRLQADALRSFLRKVGVLPGAPARAASYTIVEGYRIVTNERGGFLETAVRPGDRIREGTPLGTIRDAYGDVVETMRAPAGSDIVLGVSTYPAWPTGGWLFELGHVVDEGAGR